jgi:3-oxoadipate enol-lactonase
VDLTPNLDCCLIFWPSLFTDHILFSEAVEELVTEQKFRQLSRVLLDPPGHGKSSFEGKNLTFGDCAKVVSEILDQLNVKTCVFVGCAWGGLVGIHFAANFPHRCNGKLF